MLKNTRKKIGAFLASIAPGLFLIGYNIGTGSITTAASTGAKYGMTLIWPLLISCIFTFFLIIAFGRYTIVTGDTALHSFKEHFGKGWSGFVLVSVLISEWVSCMGVMGVVTEVVKEWSKPITPSGNGINMIVSAIIFIALLYILFWNGKHNVFEKILTVFVSIMGISFILTMFLVIPDPSEVLQGLIPSLPKESNAALLSASMVGTTMGGILYVVRSILVQEKGWTIKDMKHEKRDAFISSFMMFILSGAIMACAAGTLHIRGLEVNSAIDMVRLLEPLAGRFAISVFVAGIVSAGLSSLFPIILLGPWLFCDYYNKERNMRAPWVRILVLCTALLGLVVPIFGGRPVLVMIISQALIATTTPLIVLFMMILQNKEELMGEYKATPKFNIIMGVIFLFTIYMAISGLVGIRGLI